MDQQTFKEYIASCAGFSSNSENHTIAEMVELSRALITENWGEIRQELLTTREVEKANGDTEAVNQVKLAINFTVDASTNKKLVNAKLAVARAKHTAKTSVTVEGDSDSIDNP